VPDTPRATRVFSASIGINKENRRGFSIDLAVDILARRTIAFIAQLINPRWRPSAIQYDNDGMSEEQGRPRLISGRGNRSTPSDQGRKKVVLRTIGERGSSDLRTTHGAGGLAY